MATLEPQDLEAGACARCGLRLPKLDFPTSPPRAAAARAPARERQDAKNAREIFDIPYRDIRGFKMRK